MRSLLLLPLVVGVILGPLRLSAGRLDGLLPLYVMSGAAFGSVWAIAWMRIVGTRKQGLKRVLALAWTATCAGFTSGILIGPINLLVAVAREPATGRIEGAVVSAILDGSWLGGVLGAAGGGLAGPLLGYLYLAAVRVEPEQDDASEPNSSGTRLDGPVTSLIVSALRALPGPRPGNDCSGRSNAGRNADERFIRAGVRWGMRAVYVLMLAPPTLWLAEQVIVCHGEEMVLRQMRRSGLSVQASREYYEKPRWLLRAFGPAPWFEFLRRVDGLVLTGPLPAGQDALLAQLHALGHIDIRAPGTKDSSRRLEELTALLRTANLTVSLDLSGSDLSDGDLRHLALPGVERLVLDNTRITDAGLDHLAPGLRSLSLRYTRITDAGLERLESIPSLRYLSLGGTAVTDRGVDRLLEAFPPQPRAGLHPESLWQPLSLALER